MSEKVVEMPPVPGPEQFNKEIITATITGTIFGGDDKEDQVVIQREQITIDKGQKLNNLLTALKIFQALSQIGGLMVDNPQGGSVTLYPMQKFDKVVVEYSEVSGITLG